MAQFLGLWKDRHSMINEYFDRTKDAESNRLRELKACIAIQSLWRGYTVRKLIDKQNCACIEIQRVFRGWVGRKRYDYIYLQKKRRDEKLYHDKMATVIQRVWRGYSSRRHKRDFYKRKAFILNVLDKNRELRELSQQYLEEQARYQSEVSANQEQLELSTLARKRHHLVGTQAIRGVLQDVVMEDILRDSRTMTAPPPRRPDTTVGEKVARLAQDPTIQARRVQGPFKPPAEVAYQRQKPANTSLRMDTVYGVERTLKAREQRLNKALRIK
eukprot:gnl/Hemi2/8721_TR3021_c0_g1_i1.p1 gnl/Hemi2/8721_TR3021_c0_g1~~gnl/Hemi2/8721_TR3021_c0_g1_i1.p1  ORF type:complete len:272 (+),score=64.62 gnl/Hemi2/8721_TR3021_c0_g1_i1:117-932(+)